MLFQPQFNCPICDGVLSLSKDNSDYNKYYCSIDEEHKLFLYYKDIPPKDWGSLKNWWQIVFVAEIDSILIDCYYLCDGSIKIEFYKRRGKSDPNKRWPEDLFKEIELESINIFNLKELLLFL